MGDSGKRGGGTSPTGHEGRGRIMPRKLRVQFVGAIDHVMSRGNARQDIVADDRDRRQFLDRLGSQVRRSGWELISFVLLSNRFHLLVRTPRPDLARGMQR